ncbi:MAG: alpha/beta hydrolase fold domain-containing protein [Gemmatimonas sp.]
MRATWLGVAAIVAASVGAAPAFAGSPRVADGSAAPEIAAGPSGADRYPERRVAFPGGVVGLADLTYATPPGFRPLTLDLYLPPTSAVVPPAGFPAVVYVHGGGWAGGDARRTDPFAALPAVLASLAARGYVVASVNYRLSSEARSPAAVLDVKTAIRWLRSKDADYRIDSGRVAVWGTSAGGTLAGAVAVTCNVEAYNPDVSTPPGTVDAEGRPITRVLPPQLAQQSDCVQAAASWYGVFDFATFAEQLGVQDGAPELSQNSGFLGCEVPQCPPGLVAGASSTTYAGRGAPPMLLIHGMEDATVPHEQSEEMAGKLWGAGAPVTLILIPGVGHSLNGKTPEATRAAAIQALNATFDFFDRTVGSEGPSGGGAASPVDTGIGASGR